MANIFQGEALPALVSTAQEQQTAPEFYTNYLQDIANLGTSAVKESGVAGMSPLQIQALNMAPTAAFAGMGTMGQGAQLAGLSGSTAAPDVVQKYMNPYTQNVTDEMARLQGKSIRENVMPALQGAAGGMGQFGSQRQYQATGNTLRDLQANLLGQQQSALEKGYTGALSAAQADLQRQLSAGMDLGSIGTQQSAGAKSGLETLSSLGSMEQKQGQALLDQPMLNAQAFAKLLQGYQIPTGSTKQTVGSTGYSGSPLAQITGLLAALGSYNPTTTTSVTRAEGGSVEKSTPSNAAYHDGRGNYYDANGYLVE